MTVVSLAPLRRQADDRQPPLRLKPHHGRPRCLLEQFAQHVWRYKLLWYIAVVATLILASQWGVGSTLHNWVYR